jgi:hypothetical protein
MNGARNKKREGHDGLPVCSGVGGSPEELKLPDAELHLARLLPCELITPKPSGFVPSGRIEEHGGD